MKTTSTLVVLTGGAPACWWSSYEDRQHAGGPYYQAIGPRSPTPAVVEIVAHGCLPCNPIPDLRQLCYCNCMGFRELSTGRQNNVCVHIITMMYDLMPMTRPERRLLNRMRAFENYADKMEDNATPFGLEMYYALIARGPNQTPSSYYMNQLAYFTYELRPHQISWFSEVVPPVQSIISTDAL